VVSCIQVCHLKCREFSFLLWMLHSPPITSFLISSPKYQWRVRIIRILVMQFYPVSFYFLSHRSKYSVHRPVFKHPSSILSSKEKDQVSYLYETTGKITWERGSYGSEYEDNCLLGCDSVKSGINLPTIRTEIIFLPWWRRQQVSPKHWYISTTLHGFTLQKVGNLQESFDSACWNNNFYGFE
jgi:hypothetical protein